MIKIGIIAAMEHEMECLLDGLDGVEETKVAGIKYYEGKIGGKEVVVSLSGVGKVNAAMATTILINSFDCNLIINSGIAGGVKPLQTRDSVLATTLMYHDVDVTAFGYSYGQIPGMPKEFITNPSLVMLVKKIFKKLDLELKCLPVVSGDTFVTGMDNLKNVPYEEGYATEMEGCAVAQVCCKAGIDFIVLRYISDIIGAENQVGDYSAFEREMANRSSEVTLRLIESFCD